MDDYKNAPIIDDISLPHSLRRSIWLIKDEEDGNDYTADEILDSKSQDIIFNMRSTLTAAYKSGESKYVCPFCGEPVGLKVRTNEGDFFPFFSHYQDSDDSCPLKTTNEIDPTRVVISSENRFKESILHHDMVTKLKEVLELSQSFKEIEVDRVISSPEVTGYRRPSLYSVYHGEKKICFDALVSNPQIGLLVGRNAFYKMQKMFYLWVFPDFSTKNQRMCEKDILYMNRRNVFVFDSLDYYNNEINKKHLGNIEPNHIFAYEESIRQKRLMLNCYWQVPVINEKGDPSISWKGPKLVAFDDIVLDTDKYEAYFHDSDQDFYHSYSPEKQHLIDEWVRIKEDRWKKIFDSIEKRKILYEQTLARKEKRERLAYYYPLIESGEITPIAFQDENTKLWGYKYNDFDIIPPIYHEVKPFYLGYAWVKKAKYWGCIDYKGNRIFNFEIISVLKISDGHYKLCQKDNTSFVFVQRGNLCLYDEEIELSNQSLKVKKGEYWGVVNRNNDIIIPLEYNYLRENKNGFFKAKKSGKYGLINEAGESLLSFIYDSLDEYDNCIFKAQKDGKYGIINIDGEIILPLDYDNLGEHGNGMIVAPKDGKWGIIDEDEKIVIPFEYESIYHPKQNNIVRAKANGCWGVINKDNEQVIPFIYDEIGVFINDRAKAKQYKWGVIDKRGKTICPFEYDRIIDAGENFWRIVKINYTRENRPVRCQNRWGGVYYKDNYWNIPHEKWGMINFEGDVIIPCKYDSLDVFSDGKSRAIINGRHGYINEKGEEVYNYRILTNGFIVYESSFINKCGLMNGNKEMITGLEYNEIDDFVNGTAKANKNYRWGYISETGKEVYDTFEKLTDGLIKFKSNFEDAYGVMSDSQTIIIKPSYDQIEYFSEGIFKVKQKGNWGLINKINDIIIPFEYNDIKILSEINIGAKKYTQWGILNLIGEIIIPFEYDEIEPFKDGIAKAQKYGRWSEINEKNEEIYSYIPLDNGLIVYKSEFHDAYGIMDSQYNPKTPPHFSFIRDFHDGVALVKESGSWGKWGLVDSSGDELTGFKYDELKEFQDGKAIAKKDGYWGAINKNGRCVVPFRFSEIRNFVEGKAWASGEYGEWYLINGKGTRIDSSIPYDIDELEEFVDGKAIAYGYDEHHEKHYGVVSQGGNLIVPFDYDYLILTENNLMIAGLEHKYGVLTMEGSIKIPFDYDYIEEPIYQGKAIAKLRGKVGQIDISGNVVIPFEFDEIKYFDHGFSSAKKNGKYGIINEKGETVVPFEYIDTDVKSSHEFEVITKVVGFGWKKTKYYKIIDIDKEHAEPAKDNKNKILIEKIREEEIYLAKVTGRIKFGVFIKIPDLGDALIPAKYLKQVGKSLNSFKKGMQLKVQLLSINKEKQQATFKLVE